MPELSVASFNTHGGMAARGGDTYDLAHALDTLEADVIVLQEVWWPDAADCPTEIWAGRSGYAFHGLRFGRGGVDPRPHYVGHQDGWIGIVVLSRLPSRRVGELPLGHAFGDPVRNRRALHVEIDAQAVPVQLVGLHNTSRIVHGPALNLRRLARQLPSLGHTVVVAGDCNLWGPAVVRLLPGWRRAVHGKTWPVPRLHSQIDHVLVHGATRVVAGAPLPPVGSDHLPIRATLAV